MSSNNAGLSRYEQETIINFNNKEDYATIYTRDPVILRKLAKLAKKYLDAYTLIEEDEISKTYKCSKRLIRFGNPPKKLSEEEKELRRQLLSKYAFKKKDDKE